MSRSALLSPGSPSSKPWTLRVVPRTRDTQGGFFWHLEPGRHTEIGCGQASHPSAELNPKFQGSWLWVNVSARVLSLGLPINGTPWSWAGTSCSLNPRGGPVVRVTMISLPPWCTFLPPPPSHGVLIQARFHLECFQTNMPRTTPPLSPRLPTHLVS